MVNIEIDGIPIKANNGAMIIEAADEAGIPIARFCYHKKLSVAANCRMCLVEVDKAAKPLPACATPVTEGRKVLTRSPRALDAQRGTMEFLLINHPLDCPICDQGGECELQDVSMGYGESHSRFEEGKRVVRDKDIGPLISTEMTRSIHCTRCVRFGEELAGIKELGAVGRGENIEHRLRQCDFTDQSAAPIVPSLGCTLEELETVDCLLIVGANVRKDQPIIGHRIRKASLRGARIAVINPIDYEFRFRVAERIFASPAEMERALAGVVKALLEGGAPLPPAVATLLGDVQVNDSHRAIAALLRSGKKNAIVLGNQAAAHPAAATLRELAGMIAELTAARVGTLTAGANSAGAHLAGVLPHRGPAGVPLAPAGLAARAVLEARLKGYIVLGFA